MPTLEKCLSQSDVKSTFRTCGTLTVQSCSSCSDEQTPPPKSASLDRSPQSMSWNHLKSSPQQSRARLSASPATNSLARPEQDVDIIYPPTAHAIHSMKQPTLPQLAVLFLELTCPQVNKSKTCFAHVSPRPESPRAPCHTILRYGVRRSGSNSCNSSVVHRSVDAATHQEVLESSMSKVESPPLSQTQPGGRQERTWCYHV